MTKNDLDNMIERANELASTDETCELLSMIVILQAEQLLQLSMIRQQAIPMIVETIDNLDDKLSGKMAITMYEIEDEEASNDTTGPYDSPKPKAPKL